MLRKGAQWEPSFSATLQIPDLSSSQAQSITDRETVTTLEKLRDETIRYR